MTPNLSHVAGLELALDEMHDMLDGSCESRLNRLIAEAKSAPTEPDAELVALLRDAADYLRGLSLPAQLVKRIDAKLALLEPKP